MFFSVNLLLFLLSLKNLIRLFCRYVFMDDGADCLNHWHRMGVLPDVSAKIDTYCAFLHAVSDKFQYFHVCLCLWPACYNNRHRAAIHNLIKVFTPVCLHNLCAKFCCNAAAKVVKTYWCENFDKV